MKEFVFDSSALISYFDGEPNANKVADILEEINEKNLQSYLCVVNFGEVYYHFLRSGGEEKSLLILNAIRTLPVKIVEANIEITLAAARIKAFNKMSYADTFAAALTEQKEAILVTGDKEFKVLRKAISINFI